MMFVGFVIGVLAGTIVTTIALLWAMATRDRYVSNIRPMDIAPSAPDEIPQAAINPQPPILLVQRPDPSRPDRRGWP